MDAKQIESALIDEFFAMLNQQAQTTPPQLPAPQTERPRPYYAGPSQRLIERQQIEAQLAALVAASTARLYAMLTGRMDELEAEQQAAIEAEQKRRDVPRISPPCTPSRNSCY